MSSSCQLAVTKTERPLPAAINSSAMVAIRRTPNRSISAAANGAIVPYRIRFRLTAADIAVRGQPNSSCNGIINTLGAARNPAAPSRVRKDTAATHQAGWIQVRRRVRGPWSSR